MAGVNLLKRLGEREVEEGVVGEGTSAGSMLGGGLKDAIMNAIADLTAHQKTNLILFSISILLIFFQSDIVNLVYFEQLLEEKRNVNQQLQVQISSLENEARGFGELQDQIEEYNRKLTDLRRKIQEIEAIRKSKRDFAIRLTDYVVSELPEGVWLSGIKVDVKTTRKVELEGKSMDLTLIGVYMQRLEKGAFFPKWTLVSNSSDKLAEEDRDIRRFSIDAGIVEVQ
jgi:Tfp pilus assembly protein PilN